MLVTENLSKSYSDFKAVEKLNLEVKKGSIFGFLGHNGAGKTTTLSMLTTLILPTEGKAWIGGHEIVKDNLKVRHLIGYLPENVTLYEELTAIENLRFFGSLSGIKNVDQRIKDTLALLEIKNWEHRKVKTYSKGMKQRIGIAQAILHNPEILFLDEPTSGLDPQGTKELRDILLMLNQTRGTTIFMNTHLLSEVTKICSDIGIISKGKLIYADSVSSVTNRFPEEKSLEEIYFKIEGGKR
jgi:ABC-2 type transport system ATP-binding protein